MKPSVFKQAKQALEIRLKLIKSAIIYCFQEETAYPAENWGNLLSTLFYTITFRLFISVIYTNVDTLAGYTENETLFLLFIGQLSYYFSWATFRLNVRDLNDLVNHGDLDLVLTKPLPADFYISFSKISLIRIFRDSLAPLVFIALNIKWASLSLTFTSCLTGAIIWTLGMITTYCVYFLSVLPSFWSGRSYETYRIVYLVEESANIPLEGMSKPLRVFLGVVIPLAISVNFATSAALGKSSLVRLLIWAVMVTVGFSFVRKYAWGQALKAYTSASS